MRDDSQLAVQLAAAQYLDAVRAPVGDADGARVLLRPASPGTGIIAGKTVRAVLESAGVKDVLSKSLGSKNAANVAKATLGALQQLRLRRDIYRSRGLETRLKDTPAAAA